MVSSEKTIKCKKSTVHYTGKAKSPWVRIKASWRLYVLLLPALIYLAIFHYAPIYGLQIAFKDFVPSLGIIGSKWVSLMVSSFSSTFFITCFREYRCVVSYSITICSKQLFQYIEIRSKTGINTKQRLYKTYLFSNVER